MDWWIDRKWSCPILISDVSRIRAKRKYAVEMCLIWLWADLGAIWGRSEANLHSIRPDNRKTDPKRTPNGAKMHPNRVRIDMVIGEICFSIRHVNSRRFIKPLQYVGKRSFFWKWTFVYAEWLHIDCKVMPNWTNITFISQKWHQRHLKMTLKWPQSAPKWPQSDAKATSEWVMTDENPSEKCF